MQVRVPYRTRIHVPWISRVVLRLGGAGAVVGAVDLTRIEAAGISDAWPEVITVDGRRCRQVPAGGGEVTLDAPGTQRSYVVIAAYGAPRSRTEQQAEVALSIGGHAVLHATLGGWQEYAVDLPGVPAGPFRVGVSPAAIPPARAAPICIEYITVRPLGTPTDSPVASGRSRSPR